MHASHHQQDQHDQHHVGAAIRHAGPTALAAALQDSRRWTLATFDAYDLALRDHDLRVPEAAGLNPPRWEIGHIGWFQDWWLGRNPQRHLGALADPDVARVPAPRANADALYDSSRVPHDSRWSLPLPGAAATRADLAAQLDTSLALLQNCGAANAVAGAADDAALYFFRLALLHEDMHHEAALYMAQALDLAIHADGPWQPRALAAPGAPLHFDAATWQLGSAGLGFAFDNECGAHTVALAACSIDAQVLRWAEFLPFVEAGGYRSTQGWGPAGRAWLAAHQPEAPRYLRRVVGGGGGAGSRGGSVNSLPAGWQQRRGGVWQALDEREAACHLNAFEAEAWCAWAGRRLPTEAEWERAAIERPAEFHWGEVWEWTASVFAPYPGFTPHPYRDYSQPWFGDRPVLRGASFGTQPRMHHPRYRNYFTPERTDIFAGLRTCAID